MGRFPVVTFFGGKVVLARERWDQRLLHEEDGQGEHHADAEGHYAGLRLAAGAVEVGETVADSAGQVLRRQAEEGPDRAAGGAAGPQLEHLAEQHQRGDHGG